MNLGNLVFLIKKRNQIKGEKVQPGQILEVSLPVGRRTGLKEMAAARNLSLDKVKQFNPAIINENASLPSGYKIRLPKG